MFAVDITGADPGRRMGVLRKRGEVNRRKSFDVPESKSRESTVEFFELSRESSRFLARFFVLSALCSLPSAALDRFDSTASTRFLPSARRLLSTVSESILSPALRVYFSFPPVEISILVLSCRKSTECAARMARA